MEQGEKERIGFKKGKKGIELFFLLTVFTRTRGFAYLLTSNTKPALVSTRNELPDVVSPNAACADPTQSAKPPNKGSNESENMATLSAWAAKFVLKVEVR